MGHEKEAGNSRGPGGYTVRRHNSLLAFMRRRLNEMGLVQSADYTEEGGPAGDDRSLEERG